MNMAKRLSLTKSQRTSGIGAELLSLCQTVTEDGTLSLEEVRQLAQWLRDNRGSDLPAMEFLTKTVEEIIADKKVTHDELQRLYEAIEVVLPTDMRKDAVAARREVEAEARHLESIERARTKAEEEAERKQNAPIARFDFMVAGVHHEGRDRTVENYVNESDPVLLRRDPRNKYSRHAVEVLIANGLQIGFVPEDDARDLAKYLDKGHLYRAYIKKVLDGGRVPIPVVVVELFNIPVGQQVTGIMSPPIQSASSTPSINTSVRTSKQQKSGCLLAVIFITGLVGCVCTCVACICSQLP